MSNPLTGTRQILRNLLRSPAFTASAVLTLALGMAATTVVFSTFYHLVLRPLPFDEWQSLRYVWQERDGGALSTGPSTALVREAMQHATTFAELEAWTTAEHSLTGSGEPVMLKGAHMTAGLPTLLGVSPLIGRSITADEVREGARVVLLSEPLWRVRFGGERSVLGRSVTLGPDSYTVIGVMPARFARYQSHSATHEYWLPLRLEDVRYGISVLGRIRPGVTDAAAAAELDAIAAELPAGEGSHGEGWSHSLKDAQALGVAGINARRVLPRLLGAAVLLLLIGCANVAGLLLIRMHARRREIAVRAAVGAGRGRLLGELAVEQVLIAFMAGVLGVLCAVWSLDLIRTLRPENLASLDHISVNVPVLLFAGTLVLTTTLLFGALPALAILRHDLAGTLQTAGGARLTSGTRTRSVLVTLQLALSTLLLVGGFLLVRTMQQLESAHLGFDTERLLVATIPLPAYRYDADSREALLQDLTSAVRDVPDVRSVAVGNGAPPQLGLIFVPQLEVEGSDVSTQGIQFLRGSGITPGYLATLGARMIEGREYAAGDESNVTIIDGSFAERFFPGESALGRRIRLSPEQEWQTIIGVVDNLRPDGPMHHAGEMMMFWRMMYSGPSATLLLRTAGDPLHVAAPLRQILARLDADLPIRELDTMAQRMSSTLAAQRFNMIMIGVFAVAAVLLCGIGLYGLVSYSFEQRRREVGVRLALGATPRGIRILFMSQAVRLAAIGVPLGLAAALASVRVTAALVHGVSPRDPLAFAAAFLVIWLIVLPAGWIPARRAARTQPVVALRQD